MSIFVSVASYCDDLLIPTIDSIFQQADNPNEIFVGIVDQNVQRNTQIVQSKFADNIRYVYIDFRESRGVCWARSLASSLYQNEDWYFQIDSHTLFDEAWDTYLISLAKFCQRINSKVILSSYPNPFIIDEGKFIKKPIRDRVIVHTLDANSRFNERSAFLQFKGKSVDQREPIIGGHLAAGNIFARGDLFHEVPYDPFLYFREEEQSLSIRSFTHGWSIFHYANIPVYHLYAQMNATDSSKKLHWDVTHQLQRVGNCCVKHNEISQARLNILMSETSHLGVYGHGRKHTLADYAASFGIDYINRRISPLAYSHGSDSTKNEFADFQ
jgi:hypothetical protein